MISGKYVLSLHCDSGVSHPSGTPGHNGAPRTYEGPTQSDTIKAARRDGWRLGLTRHVCPLCQPSDLPNGSE